MDRNDEQEWLHNFDQTGGITFTPATKRDLAEMIEIERQSFPHPWSDEQFEKALNQRNISGIVARKSQVACAFAIYELHKKQIHLLNFAVGQDWRRSGIGTALWQKLTAKLTKAIRCSLEIIVSERQIDAHKFLTAMGCRCVEVVKHPVVDSDDGYRFLFEVE